MSAGESPISRILHRALSVFTHDPTPSQSQQRAPARQESARRKKPILHRRKHATKASRFAADPWWGEVSEPAKAVATDTPIARTRHERTVREEAERRNRTRKRELLRRRVRFAALIASVVLLGWLGYVVPRMGIFQIQTVAVEGSSAVPDLLIRNQVNEMLQGQTIFTVDTDAVVKKVEEQPFIRSAEVNRHLPDGLSIRVTEYEPLAFGVADDGGWLIARDGRVLNRARLDDWRARVPVVRLKDGDVTAGERLTAEPALLVLRAVPPTFPGSIRAIDKTKESGYVASLHDGPSIRLGRAQDLDRKLSVAGRMLAMFSRAEQDELEYVDVTVPARPAVKQG